MSPSWEAASIYADDLEGVTVAEWQQAEVEHAQQVAEDLAEFIARWRTRQRFTVVR